MGGRKRVLGWALGLATASVLPAWSVPLLGEASLTPVPVRAKAATVPLSAATIALPAPLAGAARKSLDAGEAPDGAHAIGFAREVAAADSAHAMARIQWVPQAGGGIRGHLAVRSSGAAALRVALAVRSAPGGVTLRFLTSVGEELSSLTAVEAIDAANSSGAMWGPVSTGEEQLIEVVLPAGAHPATVNLAVRAVSHLVADPASAAPPVPGAKSAGSCHLDVSCVPPSPAFLQAMRSVAKIVYTVNGMTYSCTATLVNDAEVASQIPYLLTAKHCIDSAAAAATVNTFWFLEAATCGSKASVSPTQLARGARLLHAGALDDVALLRLNEPAPAGAWFSGIDAAAMAAGETAIALHHPKGDLKKVSSGRVVNPAEGTAGRLVSMSWLSGTTEPGSSGSGLFTERAGQYLLRATLRGGSASCSNSGRPEDPANRDYYTRLDSDFGAIAAVLRAPAAPLEDYTDLWVVDGQPGTGISITQHASNATFVVWFSYDASGRPTWITMPGGTWTSSRAYTGTLYKTRRPDAAVAVEPAGSATLTFTDAGHATLDYILGGAAGSLRLERQVF